MSSNAPLLDLLLSLNRIRAYLNTLLSDWIANPHADSLARFQLEAIHPLNPATGDSDDLAIQIVSSVPYFPPVKETSGLSSSTPLRAWILYCWYQDTTGIRYFPISAYTEPASLSDDSALPWTALRRLRGILAALDALIIDYQASTSEDSDPSYLDSKEPSHMQVTALLRSLGSTTACVSCDGPVQTLSTVDNDGQTPPNTCTCHLILRNTSYLKSCCASEPVL